jgi:hypothetical protein
VDARTKGSEVSDLAFVRCAARAALAAVCAATFLFPTVAYAADEVLTTRGQRREADVTVTNGQWKIGGDAARAQDILVVRFSPEPPPGRMAAGVFIRGGSLIAGTLTSIIGDAAEVSSNAWGPLKLKRDDIASAFMPLPAGQVENMPELARYSALVAAALGTPGAPFQPGKRCRVRFAGLDEVAAERLMRVGPEQILVATKDKGVESLNRQFVRLIEMQTPAAPAPASDPRLGPEMIVRLKGGDLLRGRVVNLDAKSLGLRTAFMEEKQIERGMLAALFPAGESAGVTWLSSQPPVKSVHVPMFDSEFPARMDASVDGNNIVIKGAARDIPCERGIGVHSRSELEFALPAGAQRFIAMSGMDIETRGRGSVTARVLADGKELWKSATVTGKDPALLVSVELGGAKTLKLLVDFGPDEDDSGDHWDWGWAAVVQ